MKQLKWMFLRKSFLLVFLFNLILMLVNYFHHVFAYAGRDVLEMYHPMKLLAMSSESNMGTVLMQVYPLLLVVPCAFSYLDDKNSGMELFFLIRSGKKKYYLKKTAAVFGGTWTAFALPYLLEVVLNVIAFPIRAVGDPVLPNGIYEEETIWAAKNYLFADLYISHPYLYAVLGIVSFGICSGVLASFVLALSYLPFVKFRILLFLPVYAIVEILHNLYLFDSSIRMNLDYDQYLLLYEAYTENKSETAYVLFLLVLIFLTLLLTWWKGRRDSRNL